MTELKDMDNSVIITPFVSLKDKQEVIRTLHRTLTAGNLFPGSVSLRPRMI